MVRGVAQEITHDNPVVEGKDLIEQREAHGLKVVVRVTHFDEEFAPAGQESEPLVFFPGPTYRCGRTGDLPAALLQPPERMPPSFRVQPGLR